MQKLFYSPVIWFILFCGSLVYAQTADYTGREVERLGKKLDLTDQQREKISDIYKRNLAEIDQLREQNRGDQNAIRMAENDIENAIRQQIESVLTAEQQQRFAEIRQSIRLPRPHQEERFREIEERLKLTEEQSAQMEDILNDAQIKMEKIREQNSGDRDSMRPEMDKIRQETDRRIEEILTPEQFQEYQKMKNERRQGPPAGMERNRRGF